MNLSNKLMEVFNTNHVLLLYKILYSENIFQMKWFSINILTEQSFFLYIGIFLV